MKSFIVSLFKLVGGLVGAVVGLMIAMSLLSNEKSVTPKRQLEIRCEEGSTTQPAGAEQKAFYESCIASGSSVIRAQERINSEGSQTFAKPISAEGPSSPVASILPQDTAPSILPTSASSTLPPVPEQKAIAPTVPPPLTWTPSFDCAKASTGPERLICSSKELSEADVKLAQAYKAALNISADKEALRNMQSAWRKNERDACLDIYCMLYSYEGRLAQLAR